MTEPSYRPLLPTSATIDPDRAGCRADVPRLRQAPVAFHGEAVTFSTYEDQQGLCWMSCSRGGEGKVLVVDGRGSHAPCAVRRQYRARGRLQAGLGRLHLSTGPCAIRPRIHAELDFGVTKALMCSALRYRRIATQHRSARTSNAPKFGGAVINPGDYIYADHRWRDRLSRNRCTELTFGSAITTMSAAENAQVSDVESPVSGAASIRADAARANLDDGAWDYLIGGAETETTQKRNRHRAGSGWPFVRA